MTSALQVLGGGGVGIFPTHIEATFYAQGAAFAKGDVVQVDCVSSVQGTNAIDAASTSTDPGGMGTSVFSNVVTPTAGGIKRGILAVCLDASVADGSPGRFLLSGITDSVFMIAATGDIAIGNELVATTAKNLDAIVAPDERIVGIALEAKTNAGGASTRSLMKAWFNGLPGGFGMDTGT